MAGKSHNSIDLTPRVLKFIEQEIGWIEEAGKLRIGNRE